MIADGSTAESRHVSIAADGLRRLRHRLTSSAISVRSAARTRSAVTCARLYSPCEPAALHDCDATVPPRMSTALL